MYNIRLKKFWWGWFKRDVRRLYYKWVHNIDCNGLNGTLLPMTKKGKFCSVYVKGEIIEIVDEKYEGLKHPEHDMVRIIPYQPNHGVMIELYKNGKMCSRNHLDIDQLSKGIIYASNVEQLTNRK